MSSDRKKILLTCDDGIRSTGLLQLYSELAKFADVTIITSHVQRSAEGKAITINQIVRVEKEEITPDISGYSITGSSADAVIFGLNALEEGPFDLVVAGINQGLNISSHIVLTSGTCAAAFEASFYDVPAIAFSMHVNPAHYFVTPTAETFSNTAKIAAKMTQQVLEMDFPEKLAFINVNFPFNATFETPVKITKLASKFLVFRPELRKDPRQNDYYFFWGDPIKEAPAGSDIEAIALECVSISLVTSDLNFNNQKEEFTLLERLLQK
ncbi:MAG: 5'/3'-nucleotidase SurE [Candidatus Heimdallarchaeota archaeon]|nr:5'/3'-nucleotidase SurE [Candidatus Heimdallarchaeota archaeon]MBY8994088.1 5'/3'-nucleotidase SurE [Candidatus Heimdallarchaeota archaeon]